MRKLEQFVIRKNEFKVGDLCVFYEIDRNYARQTRI